MTTEEIIESIAKEIRDRGGFQNYWDFELALKRILTAKFDEAHKAAIEEDRARCLTLIDRCRVMYERYERRARARDRGEDPDFYPTVSAEESFHKLRACEYVAMVVKEWDINSDQMPMPY